MITDRDIRDQVIRSLDGKPEGFDVDAIVSEIITRWRPATLDDFDAIPSGDYWALVATHDSDVIAEQAAEIADADRVAVDHG